MGEDTWIGITILVVALVVIGGLFILTVNPSSHRTGLSEWGGLAEKPIDLPPFNVPRDYSLMFVVGVLAVILGYAGIQTIWGEP